MCWHHIILRNFSPSVKVELRFKEPLNSGFDVIIIGLINISNDEKNRIEREYKNSRQMKGFRGGIKDVLFYDAEIDAGISNELNYTMTPLGFCGVQKKIKDNLKKMGVKDFLKAQKNYNEDVRKNPTNAKEILKGKGHIK